MRFSPRGNRTHHHQHHDSMQSLCIPLFLKNGRFAFLVFVVVYLSIYHLKSQNILLTADELPLRTTSTASSNDSSSMEGREAEKKASRVRTASRVDEKPQPPPVEEFRAASAVTAGGSPTATGAPAVLAVRELQEYLPSRDPVLSKVKPSAKKPVQVHLMAGSAKTVTTRTRFLMEGVERSEYLKLVHMSFLEEGDTVKVLEVNKPDYSNPMIWMVDLWALEHDCHCLETLLRHAKTLDKKQSKKQRPHLLLMDFSGSPDQLSCTSTSTSTITELVGSGNFRIAQRTIVHDRMWDSDKNWFQLGKIRTNPGKTISSGHVLHSPYPLREAVVVEVNRYLDETKKRLGVSKLRPVSLKRPTDVIFFWRKGDNSHFTNGRREVEKVVSSLNGTMVGDRAMKTLSWLFADVETMELNVVHSRYIEEMMASKIVVVAQRDEWEDHYRLMESLATGALVFTDVMLSLPDGLVHGKNIVVYDSAESLRQQLVYFVNPDNEKERIQISKRGWEAAMGHHRCWHRVEELIFGKALTAVDKVYDDAPTTPPRRKRTQSGFTEPDGLIEAAVDDALLLGETGTEEKTSPS